MDKSKKISDLKSTREWMPKVFSLTIVLASNRSMPSWNRIVCFTVSARSWSWHNHTHIPWIVCQAHICVNGHKYVLQECRLNANIVDYFTNVLANDNIRALLTYFTAKDIRTKCCQTQDICESWRMQCATREPGCSLLEAEPHTKLSLCGYSRRFAFYFHLANATMMPFLYAALPSLYK